MIGPASDGRRLRILIDDGLSSRGNKSGVGQHSENVAKHLNAFASAELASFPVAGAMPRYFRKWAYIAATNVAARYSKYDIVHHMSHYVPLIRGTSTHVATIHDLGIVRYPETVSLAWRHYNRYAFDRAIRRSDALVTISQAVRDELAGYCPSFPLERIYVCSSGVRDVFFQVKPDSTDITPLRVKPFSYLLFVGDLSRRKNLLFLLEAFISAKRARRLKPDTELILVGRKGWGYREFEHLVRDVNGVRVLGYLPDAVLVSLYKFCKAVIFPSVYEGFGSPIVEAMSQQSPVVISNIPSSTELNLAHNKQMLVFSLGDREQLESMLEKVDQNHESIRSGLRYGDLSQYTYHNVARRHFEAYERILA